MMEMTKIDKVLLLVVGNLLSSQLTTSLYY